MTILSTDMSEAFDSFCHSLTINWMLIDSVALSSLDLIRSFLHKRFNRVKINDNISEWQTMERGCPQSMALGRLLWNMFQNDMSYHVAGEPNLTMYADHHQLYVTGKTHEAVDSDLTSQGWQALAWYKNNFLLANPEKFQSLSINPSGN